MSPDYHRRDRLVGAALLALEYGETPRTLVDGIRAALRFRPDGDESAARLGAMLEEDGIDAVLREVCGLEPDAPLYTLIRQRWESAC